MGKFALYLTVLAASFGESSAFVGLLVPGVAVVLGAGLLAARGQADPLWIGALASVGSMGGFWLSYRLGVAGGPRIARWSARARAALDRAGTFFHRYGAWSLFLGHFFGPGRALVPLAAGASGLPPRRFWPAAAAGAVVWGYGLTLVGVVASGGWSLVEAALGRASLFLILLAVPLYLAVRVAAGALLLGLRLIPPAASIGLRALTWIGSNQRLGALFERFPRFGTWVSYRLAPDHSTGLVLTTGALACLVFAWLFMGVLGSVVFGDAMIRVDERVFQILQLMRTKEADHLFLVITCLGNAPPVLCAIFAPPAVLFWLGRRFEAALLPLVFGSGESLMWVIKEGFARTRPVLEAPVLLESSGAFPSNHAFSTTVLYGCLAYLVGRSLSPKGRVRWYAAVGTVIAAIGISRLYLGVHWLSDVLAGYAMGAIWLTAVVTAVEIRHRFGPSCPPVGKWKARVAAALTAAVILAAWAGSAAVNLHEGPPRPQSPVAPVLLNEKDLPRVAAELAQNPVENLPGMVVGVPRAVVAGTKHEIVAGAEAGRWVATRPLNLAAILGQLALAFWGGPDPGAPTSPAFWRGRPHDLSLARPVEGGRRVVRLWSTGYEVRQAGEVWVCWEAYHPFVRRFPGVVLPGRVQPAAIADFILALKASGRFADISPVGVAGVRLVVQKSSIPGAVLDTGGAR